MAKDKAEDKPEKVDIRVGTGSDKAKDKPKPKPKASTDSGEQQPTISNFRHSPTPRQDDSETGEEPKLRTKTGKTITPTNAKPDKKEESEEDNGSGESTTPPEKDESQDLADDSQADIEQSTDKEDEEAVDSGESEAKTTSEDDEDSDAIAREDAAYAHGEEFYSSKFDPNHPDRYRHQAHQQSPGKKKSSRPLLIFVIFLLVAAIGIAILYYLEIQEPGSGLVFDLLQRLDVW